MNKKQIIYIVIISILLLSIMFYYFYKLGKKSNPSNTKIGKDEAGTTELTDAEIEELKQLAIALHNDMDGMNWNWDKALYKKVSTFSDTKLVALSNIFNTLYESESGETFVSWLKNEVFYWNDYSLDVTVNDIIVRLGEKGVF